MMKTSNKNRTVTFFLFGIVLSTIYINYVPTSRAASEITSPIQQVEKGVHVLDVKCGGIMILILKAETAMPFCVKPSSVNPLVTRGWAILPSDLTPNNTSDATNENFSKVILGQRNYHLTFLVSSSSPQYADNLLIFEKYLKSGDCLLVEGNENSESAIKQKIQKIKSLVNPGVNVGAIRIYNDIDTLVNKVPNLPRGFRYIGYDYEQGTGFSPEFTINATRSMEYFDQARNAVHQYNLKTNESALLIIMPPFGQIGKSQWNWGLAAKHTDILSIQFQAFIKDRDFLNYVLDTTAQIKQESASAKMMVEVSLVSTRGTPHDNLQAISMLYRLPIDSFFVFYHPYQTSELAQFLSIVSDK